MYNSQSGRIYTASNDKYRSQNACDRKYGVCVCVSVHTVCTSDVKACAISRRHTVQYETAIWIDQIEWPVYFRCNQFLYKHCWLSIDTKSNHCLIHCAFQPPQLMVSPLKWTELMKPISILLFCNIYNKQIHLASKAFGQWEGGEIQIKLTHWKVYLLEKPIIIRIYTHTHMPFSVQLFLQISSVRVNPNRKPSTDKLKIAL